MAAETDRTTFRSNLRKEPRSTGGTRDRRKLFEDTGDTGGSNSSSSGATSSSVASRYNRSTSDRDRNESPSSTTRGTTSVTSRFNRMNIDDDVDKKEEEEDRRPVKKYGGSSIASRINKATDGDDDDDGDSEKEKEEEEAPKKKPIKKAGTTAKGQKRKDKKNLREKRRSTGVVIMPGQPVAAGDAEQKEVAENTARNMGAEDNSTGASAPSEAQLELAKQNETIIEELKEELAKAHRELDKLQADNLRLKDENSALLRVVGSLSGTRR